MIKETSTPCSECKSNYFIEWKIKGVILIFLIAFFMTGCVGPRYTWKIEPYRQSVENEYFSASISPTAFNIWGEYEAFDLTIKNKTSGDIELDWNKTIYIENNQTKGGFMFEGVVYKDRNNPKPPDIIFSGSEFRKTIWPNALVSFYRSWQHDAIPSGQGELRDTSHINLERYSRMLTVHLHHDKERRNNSGSVPQFIKRFHCLQMQAVIL